MGRRRAVATKRSGELWQGGEDKSCDKEEMRRTVARRRAVRVNLDVISRKFSSNYVPSLCIMPIFLFLGV